MRIWLNIKVFRWIWLEVVLHVFLDHLLADRTYPRTKVTSRPKMPSPVALFQGRKRFKQRGGCPLFDAGHYLAWRQLGGARRG